MLAAGLWRVGPLLSLFPRHASSVDMINSDNRLKNTLTATHSVRVHLLVQMFVLVLSYEEKEARWSCGAFLEGCQGEDGSWSTTPVYNEIQYRSKVTHKENVIFLSNAF